MVTVVGYSEYGETRSMSMLEAGLGEPLLRLQLRELWEATEGSSPSSFTLNNGMEL